MNLCKESLKIQACWDSNPELCDTSVGLEQTTFFFYCDHCWKRKINYVTNLKIMIITLERHLSPPQSHSHILIPPA